MEKIRQINIKSRTSYFYNEQINQKDFDASIKKKKKKKIQREKHDRHKKFPEKKRHIPKKFYAKLPHILRKLQVI